MVKHTQTIRRQKPMNYLNVFNNFLGLALKGLRYGESSFLISFRGSQYRPQENE